MQLKLDMTFRPDYCPCVSELIFSFIAERRTVRCISVFVHSNGTVTHPDLLESDKDDLEQRLKLSLMNFRGYNAYQTRDPSKL